MKSGAYEAAAGSCYIIFRCLAKTCKDHENWFCGFTGYGDTYTKLAIFTEAVVELYCHLRQKTGLSKRMADEMDINLEVFNLETDFFGDLHCSSRFTDMLCDAQAQYGDYSELEKCPMWGMWKKEGEDEMLDDMDFHYNKVKCRKIEGMLPKLMKMVEWEMKSMR